MKLKFYDMIEKAEEEYNITMTYDRQQKAYRVEDISDIWTLGQFIGAEHSGGLVEGDDGLSFRHWFCNNYLYIQPA